MNNTIFTKIPSFKTDLLAMLSAKPICVKGVLIDKKDNIRLLWFITPIGRYLLENINDEKFIAYESVKDYRNKKKMFDAFDTIVDFKSFIESHVSKVINSAMRSPEDNFVKSFINGLGSYVSKSIIDEHSIVYKSRNATRAEVNIETGRFNMRQFDSISNRMLRSFFRENKYGIETVVFLLVIVFLPEYRRNSPENTIHEKHVEQFKQVAYFYEHAKRM